MVAPFLKRNFSVVFSNSFSVNSVVKKADHCNSIVAQVETICYSQELTIVWEPVFGKKFIEVFITAIEGDRILLPELD